ncbi:hypothetical protein Tco_0586408 [Tanacetum coccineum]
MSASSSQDEIPPPPPPPSSQTPTQQTPHTVSTIKMPILKKGEYDIWAMKIWSGVIWSMGIFGPYRINPIWRLYKWEWSFQLTSDYTRTNLGFASRTAREIVARGKDERKARTTLLMPLPKNSLYPSTEGLHKVMTGSKSSMLASDSMEKAVSTEDANLKIPRFVPSFAGQQGSYCIHHPYTQNVAFVSENTSSTNEVSTAYSVPNLSGQNTKNGLEVALLVAMISMRMKSFTRSGRKLHFDAKRLLVLIKTKVGMPQLPQTGSWIGTNHSDDEDYAFEALQPAQTQTQTGLKNVEGTVTMPHQQDNFDLNHLIRDCDFHEKRMARKADLKNVWNNVHRVNKQNQFVPSAVLTRTGIIPVSTARASSTKNFSTDRQALTAQKLLTKTAMKVNTVNTAKVQAVSTVGGKRETVVKPSAGLKPKQALVDVPGHAMGTGYLDEF